MKLEYVHVEFPGLRACCVLFVVFCAFKVLGSKPLFTKRPKRARAQLLPLLSDPSIELRPTRLTNLTKTVWAQALSLQVLWLQIFQFSSTESIQICADISR